MIQLRGGTFGLGDTCGRSKCMIKEVMSGTINGKRPRGWPRQRWIDIVSLDLEKCAPGLRVEESEEWR